MHDNLIIVVDYDKICRLCLQSTGAMSNIFEDAESSLLKLIHRCTGLELQQDPCLPSKICHKCRYLVELSCDFQDLVTKAHVLLTQSSVTVTQQDSTENSIQAEDIDINIAADKYEGSTFDDVSSDEFRPDEILLNNATRRAKKVPPKHLTCQICLTTFATMEDVKFHVIQHYADSELTSYLELKRPFKCEECKMPMSKTEVVKHHRQHLGVNPYVCQQPGCNFVGKNQESFRHHAVRHAARCHTCELCGASYRRRWELRQHQIRSHRAAPTRCHQCKRTFRNYITYNAHMTTHFRPPRHKCSFSGCPKAYHSRTALAVHARSHADERVYKCRLCVAAYTSQSTLNRHMRMHLRARKSKCDKCAATFDDYGAFYRHRVAEHGPWLPYRCQGCNQGYQTESKMVKHTETCELAIRIQSSTQNKTEDITANENTQDNVTTIEHDDGPKDTIGVESKILQVDPQLLKGQSLLVQPGNVSDLNKDCLVLQELPADGLLYIEVDPDSEDENVDQSWK